MKINNRILALLAVLLLTFSSAEANKLPIDKEFEPFWKEFQKSYLKKDFEKLNKLIAFPLQVFNGSYTNIINEIQFKENIKTIDEQWRVSIKNTKIKDFGIGYYNDDDVMKNYVKLNGNPIIYGIGQAGRHGPMEMWFIKVDNQYKLVFMQTDNDVFGN